MKGVFRHAHKECGVARCVTFCSQSAPRHLPISLSGALPRYSLFINKDKEMKFRQANSPIIRSIWRLGRIALLVALLIWLAAPQHALAATFTVTKTADTSDGACSNAD